MNELAERQKFLPDTIEDLRDFILIGKERLKAQAAKIRAIVAIGMAEEAKQLAQDDAHDAGTIVIYAEAKLGELLRETELKREKESSTQRTSLPSLPSNITKKLSHEAQTIANNPEKVAQIIIKAKEENRIPTPASVYKKIKESEKPPHPKKETKDSKNLSQLKFYWSEASTSDRKKFRRWLRGQKD